MKTGNEKSPWDSLDIQGASNLEQVEQGLSQYAGSLVGFFKDLLHGGFTRTEALAIVIKFMEIQMGSALDGSQKK